MSEDQTIPQEENIEQLQKDLNDAIAQAQANLNGWKRTAADFENFKKRKEQENKELLEFAKEVTVVKLLPVIDSLEQALRHMPEYQYQVSGITYQATLTPNPLPEGEGNQLSDFSKKYQSWQAGINVLLKQLDKTLEEMGVKKIEAVGKKFDPHFHEAIREVESEADDGIVVDELQSGFELNGKVIRPSQVIISKKVTSNK